MGDFNATTPITDSTAKSNNEWAWLKSQKRGGRLHDVLGSFHDPSPLHAHHEIPWDEALH